MATPAPSPRSLVLDLLSTVRRGSMPVSALVAAGALFGLAEGSVRVALARLLAAGRVERDERGRYRLGGAAEPIQRLVAAWRDPARRTVAWNGAWIGVHGAGPRERAARRRRGRALRLLGFAGLAPGLAVRPANLRGGCDAVREELRRLGLEAEALVFELRGLDAAGEAAARALWDVEALRGGYRASLEALEASGARLGSLPVERAMVESFGLGGHVIQQLVLDPLLPEAILPTRERDALVEAMRRYDRLGRRCWADFMARHGALHVPTQLQTPADTRMVAGVDRLALA